MKTTRIGGDPRRLRERRYMPVGEQLDAILKGFKALQSQGFLLPDETADWVRHCEQVKERAPKRAIK